MFVTMDGYTILYVYEGLYVYYNVGELRIGNEFAINLLSLYTVSLYMLVVYYLLSAL